LFNYHGCYLPSLKCIDFPMEYEFRPPSRAQTQPQKGEQKMNLLTTI
jgi:hypothetical protein